MRQLLRLLASSGAASLLLVSAGAYAQATRTWVSGVGDDVNPCSRTAPCKTFAGAISKTAAAGVISVLDPGGFGTVTITKSMTIDGGGVEGSILGSLTAGVIVNAAATDLVVLRNLTIAGGGNGTSGIRVLNAAKVVVERVDISGFDIGIEQASAAQVDVHDSYLNGNRSYGMLIQTPAGRTMIDQTRLVDNGSMGLRLEGTGIVTVRRSTASGNATAGFYANGAGAFLSVDDSLVANSSYGFVAGSGSTVSVSNSSIVNATTRGLLDAGGSLVTFGNNRFSGNALDGAFNGTALLK
jgi:hypothetical protein